MGLILFDAGLLQLSMASRTDLYVNRINSIDVKDISSNVLADIREALSPSNEYALAA